MRHYAGWSEDNEYYITMKEIHADFFECLLEHVGKIEPEYGFEFDVDRIPDRVQMYQWLNMWGNLTHGARAMVDFPIWLQILPKILFKVINRRDDGIVSYEELRCFYRLFIKLPEDQVETITREAFRALTSVGYPSHTCPSYTCPSHSYPSHSYPSHSYPSHTYPFFYVTLTHVPLSHVPISHVPILHVPISQVPLLLRFLLTRTQSGDFPLTEQVYLMAFANFLLGKTPHGPGKYIFGGFKDCEAGQFQVDYSCLMDPNED
ncbi:hypothetical protein Pcinc_026765 [Petrolisthes cinctipes]|uniref:Uncharacterized protein n=1 Tax=Petrolisthes cinctipes TaxID=88211 RepID=A0AAE1KBT7_PETCI|nr:hypothetical protein Pcinc_026765 [Petrolisthes cinctipes]